ncbi:MAG TPA: cell wall-binding repeat-containing protein, partial [Kineosporiaceae bacterium]|nr:cell wall-binding repeat-containing protein [Kineosporiaceae bacterium]
AALATTVAAAAVAAAADRPLFLVPGAPTKVATPSAGPSATAGPSAGPSATAGPSTPSPSTPGVGPVPPAVAAALRALGVRGTACVGSAAELPEVVCAGLPGCTRVAGTDPAGTAAALARAFDRTITLATVAVTASGPAQLTDALAAAAVGFPVLYAGRTAPAASVALLQGEPAVSRIVVLGGAGGVPDAVVAQLRRA